MLSRDLVLNRADLINWLIVEHGYKSYLEIGIEDGGNFSQIRCPDKTGVDPSMACPEPTIKRCSSEEFFARNSRTFDLVFIDGLHHADVVYGDIQGALKALTPHGMIVCHDLNPSTEVMQWVPRVVKEWTGDCWKAWIRVRQERNDLFMAVADIDYGLGVIFPAATSKTSRLYPVPRPTWDDFQLQKADWLPLMSVDRLLKKLGSSAKAPDHPV